MSHARRVAACVLAVLLLAACSPEADRTQGGGLGADVGNSRLPIQMHGDQARNNPSFETPGRGAVPNDAKGVSGWWGTGTRR